MLSCGVDIGTTNCKIALVDGEGCSLWCHVMPTPRLPHGDLIATDGLGLLQMIEAQILQGWLAVGKGRRLVAICTTGVGEDGIYVDENLHPLFPTIAWFDRSAQAQAQFIRAHAPSLPQTGIMMDETRTAVRWLWYREHHPHLVDKSQKWIALVDFPAVWWTGTPFISETLAARTGCYDVENRVWCDELLEFCGAPKLPPVVQAGEVVGTPYHGLLLEQGVVDESTLIIAGGHDHPMAASFIWRMEPTARVDSIGTANVVYGETGMSSVPQQDKDIAFSVPLLKRAGFERALACLGVYEFSAAVKKLEERGVDIKAFLSGSHLIGLPLEDGVGDVNPRIVFEQAGFAARRMMEKMAKFGVVDGPIFATGGWSRSLALLQLRASIYAEPVHYLEEQEPALVGAALLGFDAHGVNIGVRPPDCSYHVMAPNAELVPFYEKHYREQP